MSVAGKKKILSDRQMVGLFTAVLERALRRQETLQSDLKAGQYHRQTLRQSLLKFPLSLTGLQQTLVSWTRDTAGSSQTSAAVSRQPTCSLYLSLSRCLSRCRRHSGRKGRSMTANSNCVCLRFKKRVRVVFGHTPALYSIVKVLYGGSSKILVAAVQCTR